MLIMRFEHFLMMQRVEENKRLHLEEEVAELQEELAREQSLNQILQCTLHGPLVCRSWVPSLLPPQVQVLLAEIAMVEEEIIYLERKVEDLKLSLHQERKQRKEWYFQQQQQQQWWQRQQKHTLCGLRHKAMGESPQFPYTKMKDQSAVNESNGLPGLVAEIRSISYRKANGREVGYSQNWNEPNQHRIILNDGKGTDTPNNLSEQLIKILISIFHKLNQSPAQLGCEEDTAPKLTISCMSSRSFMSRSSSNSKTPTYSLNHTQVLDPYSLLLDGEGKAGDIRSYKNFVHFTSNSLDMSRITLCIPAIGRLRVLMHKLCAVELSFLTYKQKLAFWINMYNACIMHAFLQHGLPASPDKLLGLLNKAAVNVGGIVLNALAIEHFILRHSSDIQTGSIDEKEALLRHAYGLGYPEPNVTFALCRGSWSSPALRIYTAENVVNELERAKVEYLEATVGITSKKKIFIPKLLHMHMGDFADDVESLVEWIYSQLPRSGSLKKSIMECLSADTKVPLIKMVEIQPYEAEFRYLLPF